MIGAEFWDLEISFADPRKAEAAESQDTDIWDMWPFGVSVGAICGTTKKDTEVWFDTVDGDPAPVWSLEYTDVFVHRLKQDQEQGIRLVTWNGTGFDWRLLARITGDLSLCVDLCARSYDPCFQVLCERGFTVGLSGAAKAAHLQDKEMSGASAPMAWAAGEYDQVIEYVKGDVTRLRGIMLGIAKSGGLKWITTEGGVSFHPFRHGLLTVEECLTLPLPNTSWLTDPIKREDVIKWWYGW